MKIYTKTGDQGQTSLFGGTKVSKNHVRLEAYGTIDELNSCIGLLSSKLQEESLNQELYIIQNSLFNVGAEIATPKEKQHLKNEKPRLQNLLQTDKIRQIENWIDEKEEQLPTLKQFIIPGGSEEVATAHIVRTVCRRSERALVALHEFEEIREEILRYINRLSDYFFVLARYIALKEGKEEIIWTPDV